MYFNRGIGLKSYSQWISCWGSRLSRVVKVSCEGTPVREQKFWLALLNNVTPFTCNFSSQGSVPCHANSSQSTEFISILLWMLVYCAKPCYFLVEQYLICLPSPSFLCYVLKTRCPFLVSLCNTTLWTTLT